VGYVAGAEDGVASFEVMKLVAHLDDVFAFEDVEPLVFDSVEMEGWTSLFCVVVLHGEEVAATIFGRDFEGGGSVGQGPLYAVTVFAAGDGREVGGSRGCGLEGGGEETGRKCGSEELKKRAAFECGHRSLLEGMGVSIEPMCFFTREYSWGSSFARMTHLSRFATKMGHPMLVACFYLVADRRCLRLVVPRSVSPRAPVASNAKVAGSGTGEDGTKSVWVTGPEEAIRVSP
jgi:hypothetical protein